MASPLCRDSLRIIPGLIACHIALVACAQKKEPAAEAPGASASASASASAARDKAASAPAPQGGEKLYVKVTGRRGDDLGKPALVFANRGDKAIVSFELSVYAYDGAGTQLSAPSRVTRKPVRPIAPGEIRELEMDLGNIPSGATVEVVVTHLVFMDQTEWRDDSVAPEQRPKSG